MTINVSNINFDSSGNNGLFYNVSTYTISFVVNNAVYSINSNSLILSSNVVITSVGIFANSLANSQFIKTEYDIGEIVFVVNSSVPSNTVLANTNYSSVSYPLLANIYSYVYSGSTFKTPQISVYAYSTPYIRAI